MDFYGSNDPTNSVKALNEDRSKAMCTKLCNMCINYSVLMWVALIGAVVAHCNA